MRRLIAFAVLGFAGYVLFAGTVSASELMTGFVISLLAAGWAMVAPHYCPGRFGSSAAHGLVWLRALRGLPGATARTGAALLRALVRRDATMGTSAECPFRHGKPDDPGDRGRRAAAVLAASLAPASFVVELAPARDRALLHGVDRRPLSADREWLA